MLPCMGAIGEFNGSSLLSGLLGRNGIVIVIVNVIDEMYLHHQVCQPIFQFRLLWVVKEEMYREVFLDIDIDLHIDRLRY